jgi:hypothetical protein
MLVMMLVCFACNGTAELVLAVAYQGPAVDHLGVTIDQ